MRKVNLILIVYFILSSCTAIRHYGRQNQSNPASMQGGTLLDRTVSQNIGNSNYFIQKADVELITDTEKESFIANIKYIFPDKYLISLRSKTGIEAARIYISRDTILANDRINRKLFFGNPDYIYKKFDIPSTAIQFILGDFIGKSVKNISDEDCIDGELETVQFINGKNFNCTLDCKRCKLLKVNEADSFGKLRTEVLFSKFIRLNNGYLPSEIELHNKDGIIRIKILKIEIPWSGNIEFIPGNRYELNELI